MPVSVGGTSHFQTGRGLCQRVIEEIVIDSCLDAGCVSWALRTGVPPVARALNKMVASVKVFVHNEERFGTSFVLYSGLISFATGNLSHHKLVVHDAMAHPADTSVIQVVGWFRAHWLSYALLTEHTPLSTRDDVLFLVVDKASVNCFLQLQTTWLCDSAPTSAHSILGRPVRDATPEYENSRNESSLSSVTRSGSLVSSDSPEFTVDDASAGAVSIPSAFSMGKRALHDGVRAVPTHPTQSKASGSAVFPNLLP